MAIGLSVFGLKTKQNHKSTLLVHFSSFNGIIWYSFHHINAIWSRIKKTSFWRISNKKVTIAKKIQYFQKCRKYLWKINPPRSAKKYCLFLFVFLKLWSKIVVKQKSDNGQMNRRNREIEMKLDRTLSFNVHLKLKHQLISN